MINYSVIRHNPDRTTEIMGDYDSIDEAIMVYEDLSYDFDTKYEIIEREYK